MALAGIEKPAAIAADPGGRGAAGGDRTAPGRVRDAARSSPVSILDDASLDAFRDRRVARSPACIRVRLRHDGTTDEEPLALPVGRDDRRRRRRPSTEDLGVDLLGRRASGARRRGSTASASGATHVVEDGDVVEIVR